MTPEERSYMNARFAFLLVNVWARYRSLLHVMAAHGVGPAEQLEHEAEQWARAHEAELSREALAKWDEFVAKLERSKEPPPG